MGYFLQQYRWLILSIWIVLIISCATYLWNTTHPFKIGSVADPHAESSIAENIMTDKLAYGGGRVFVLYQSKKLLTTDPQFMSEVKQSLDGLKNFSLGYHTISPYENPKQISKNKHTAYAVVIMNKTSEETAHFMPEFRRALGQPKHLRILIGGEPTYIADVKHLSQTDLFRAELIAFPLSIIALICIFGSVVLAFLPIISGVVSVLIIITILFFLGHQLELTVFVLNIATMLGLGLSLDYALLMVNRFREELANGHDVREAMKIMLSSAGKAVFFSGLAVLVSMAALLAFPVNILYSIGIGGVIVVFISVASSLIFLPVMLSFLGKNVNALTIPFFKTNIAKHIHHTFLFRFATRIMRHPYLFFFPTVIFLLFLGYPFLHVKINRPDSSILPSWVESRQLLEQFKKNFNAQELTPIYIVLKSKNTSILTSSNISRLYDFANQLNKDKRVKSIESIVTTKPKLTKQQYQALYSKPNQLTASQKELLKYTTKGRYTVMTVVSQYPVNDNLTFNLIKKIRNTSMGDNITVQVTGGSAFIIDTIKSVYVLFFKIIIVISIITYIVLLLLLRSLILPFKAIVMNLLSLMVSYGMLVYIYQDGHFASFLHFKAQGFTDMNLPILLFFGLFGLSMDYEVFLLARIKEYHDMTGNSSLSVAMGLERSARIITSAALIVIIVSCSFVTADIIFIKAFGLGTALAVAIDASFIRILLVPATMRLMGKWNWYLPKWLDKILPDIKES